MKALINSLNPRHTKVNAEVKQGIFTIGTIMTSEVTSK